MTTPRKTSGKRRPPDFDRCNDLLDHLMDAYYWHRLAQGERGVRDYRIRDVRRDQFQDAKNRVLAIMCRE